MSLSDLLASYGYPVVFLGALLEGETILALAGFAAHRGHLQLPAVVGLATAGSALGDQIWFMLGHRWGARLLSRYPRFSAAVRRVQPRLRGHADLFVLINRFLVGLRMAGPFSVGMTGMSWTRFTVLDLAGAAMWSCAIAVTGYVVGEGLERLLGDIRRLEVWIILGVLTAAVLLFGIKHLRARRQD
jgi:membrane protein DedA with SNARE-associated domain